MEFAETRFRLILASGLRMLEHNPNHHIAVHVAGRDFHLCTRCSGMWAGLFLGLPPAVGLHLFGFPGEVMAAIGILFFLPDFMYWALTRVKILPDFAGIRVANGVLLGIGIACYGQARIAWDLKLAIPLLLFAMVIVADPILGRRARP